MRIWLLILLLASYSGHSQDSTRSRESLFLSIGAGTMLAASMLTMRSKESLQSDINANGILHTDADDYLEFAPVVAGGAMHLFGVEGRHDPLNGLICLAKAELGMAALVFPMKNFFGVMRPDSSASNSLPSGHTAQAFVAATWLHYEFGHNRWWLSSLAFGSAATVAWLRVRKDRHWTPDVLLGGAIGMFSAIVVFETHQYRWGGKQNKGLTMVPMIGEQNGIYLSYRF